MVPFWLRLLMTQKTERHMKYSAKPSRLIFCLLKTTLFSLQEIIRRIAKRLGHIAIKINTSNQIIYFQTI